ncbi:site-specific DNA-methyltransferase [Campylobacter upsaliensis]|nr:site-specific DNA-methyltransferase [Campylobacter upsaliensis]
MSNTPHSLTLHNPKNSLTILECQDSKQDSSTQNERDNDKLKNSLKAGANLLIKGNNLLCLHSLKKKFANKIKLIYIDPPYNTGNDSFNYNDNFNHSTWLTFMKNRLEIARDFLRDDGVIFIQCDDNEQAYLKVLCDEIFGRENFVCNFACIVAPAGTQSSVFVAQQHNYCLAYAKNKSNLTLFNIANTEQELKEKYKEKDKYGFYYSERLWKRGQGGKKEDVPSLHFPVYYDEIKDKIYIDSEAKNVKNLIKIIPYQTKGVLGRWTWSKEKMLNEKHKLIIRKVNNEYVLHKKNYRQDDKGKLPYSVITSDIARTEIGSLEIKEIFNDKVFNYPKSEKFLKRIIEISTQENDLVMDFFAGSGTTLAVAHKMKRRFIGIEQMEYIESITKERLKKVINGEQGGISKAVDWQGGGSFIYAELMPLNAIYKERIKNINDEKTLDSIYKDLESKAFLDYRIDLDSILKDKEFKELDLQEKKEVLLDILDSNMDYVLYGDIEDKDYAISSEVIELNKIFYGDDNV